MKTLLLMLFLILSFMLYSQTMIEMMNPNDANTVLLQVFDTAEADVIIYITDVKEEWQEWD